MSPASLSAFGAAGSMAGYLYQVRIALLWAIRRSRVGDFTVSIETLDDVSFEVSGKADAVLQIAPPLTSDDAVLEEIVDAMREVLADAGKLLGLESSVAA